MSGPQLDNVKLQPCCHEALQEIGEKQELGKLLASALSASPFMLLLGSNPIQAGFSISTTDWDLYQDAVRAVPAIVKNRCQLICSFEVLNHPGGPLGEFWQAMYESFS